MEIVEIQGKRLLMGKVAKLYSKIFREEPWNENLAPAEVMEIMIEQFSRPQAIALAALEEDEVIGFTWVYEISLNDLREGTRHSPELRFLFEQGKRVFYFQEVGMEKAYRRRGLGEQLAREILEKAKRLGMNTAVLSTNQGARPALSMFSKIGFVNSGIVRPPKELGRTYWILR